jgi:two-component system NtrC family response regulator
LLVDDDESLRRVTEHHLTQHGHEVTTAADGHEALEALDRCSHDLVLTDLRMPGMDGLSLLREIQRRGEAPPVILVTAHATVDTAVEAMKVGAHDYIAKPFSRDELHLLVDRALEHTHLRRENKHLRETLTERHRIENLIAASDAMAKVVKMIGRLAHSDASVLIQGESGTGKEVVARAIHFTGERREGPYVAVNCSAIPHDLLESVLFGHIRGAFTGATDDREGKFEAAHGGTLFLDEIADMSLDLQAKILRALQEREIERVGSNTPMKVDVRIIAATNRPISDLLESGNFREDLYFRLNVVPIWLPPLRERPEDIEPLVHHLLKKLGAPDVQVDPPLLDALADHEWPGNVRELENLLERMLVFRADKSHLTRDDLPEDFPLAGAPTPADSSPTLEIEIPDGGLRLDEVERHLITRALEKAEGNKSKTARLLGITRQTLLYRLQKHGLDA